MTITPPRINLFVKSTILSACLAATTASALPTTPGFTILGLTGDNTMGYGDMLLPLFGQPTSFFHINPQVLGSTGGEYSGSLGAGARRLTESAGILGAYVFADYNRVQSGNHYWFVSPGVERLGEFVDVSANVYIPTGQQRRENGVFTGEELGITDHVFFEHHSHFDSIFHTFESVGTGVDAEVGFRIPTINNPKLYVGGYYFNPKDSNSDNRPQGLTARLEVPLTDQLTLVASDGYDQVQRNTFKIGASYSFGGRTNSKNFKGDLKQRMVDPIRRNVIAVSGPSNTAQPAVQDSQLVRENVLIRDHITFFDVNVPGHGRGDGTAENPYRAFNQDNVDDGNKLGNRNFYVNSGTYGLFANTITLTNNSIFGRQNNFFGNAVGDRRPLFTSESTENPAFIVMGDNNMFQSVRISGTDGKGVGIFMKTLADREMTFSIHNSDVKSFENGVEAHIAGKTLNFFTDGSRFENNSLTGMYAHGAVKDDNNLRLTAYRSSFSNSSIGGGEGLYIENVNNLTLNIYHSSFDNNGLHGLFACAQTLEGNIHHSYFNGNGTHGIEVMSPASNLSISHSTLNDNGEFGVLMSIDSANDTVSNLSISHSTINNSGIGTAVRSDTGGGTVNVVLYRTSFAHNSDGGVSVENAATSTRDITVTSHHSTFSGSPFGLALRNSASGEMTVYSINDTFKGNGVGVFGENLSGNKEQMSITLVGPMFSDNTQNTNRSATENSIDWR